MTPINRWRLKKAAWLCLFPLTLIASLGIAAVLVFAKAVDEELVPSESWDFLIGFTQGEWIKKPKPPTPEGARDE